MKSNSQRILGEIVFIEAWHAAFSDDRAEVELKLEVFFGEARIGGEKDDKISFKVRLREALVRVILNEDLVVDLDSVWRPRPEVIVERKEHHGTSQAVKAKAEGRVSASGLVISMDSSGSQERASTRETNLLSTGAQIEVIHQRDEVGNHQYRCKPNGIKSLIGHAFPSSRVIMKVTKKTPSIQIGPVIKVQIICRREELEILDIETKEPKLLEKLNLGVGKNEKYLIAMDMIRDALVRTGLEFSDASHQFASLVVADVVAETN